MTNLAVLENKISSAKKYLKILERYKKYSKKEIETDLDKKGATERYLYLAVQATSDLAEATVSYRNFRKPTTMTEAFYILNEEKIISDELTEKMVRMIGFRNIIAHDYEKVDFDIVYDVLQNKLTDIENFLDTISSL